MSYEPKKLKASEVNNMTLTEQHNGDRWANYFYIHDGKFYSRVSDLSGCLCIV